MAAGGGGSAGAGGGTLTEDVSSETGSGPGSGGASGAARSGGLTGTGPRDISSSYSCFASSIALLNPIGSWIMRKRSIPLSDAVRMSRSPNPNIRPKSDWLRAASLIFSSELSVECLLITPPTCITRRLVITYSWWR